MARHCRLQRRTICHRHCRTAGCESKRCPSLCEQRCSSLFRSCQSGERLWEVVENPFLATSRRPLHSCAQRRRPWPPPRTGNGFSARRTTNLCPRHLHHRPPRKWDAGAARTQQWEHRTTVGASRQWQHRWQVRGATDLQAWRREQAHRREARRASTSPSRPARAGAALQWEHRPQW